MDVSVGPFLGADHSGLSGKGAEYEREIWAVLRREAGSVHAGGSLPNSSTESSPEKILWELPPV